MPSLYYVLLVKQSLSMRGYSARELGTREFAKWQLNVFSRYEETIELPPSSWPNCRLEDVTVVTLFSLPQLIAKIYWRVEKWSSIII